jgi:hypothetical protein
VVVRAVRRIAGDVVVLVRIRHVLIRDERADSYGDRDVGGDHFHHGSGDDVDQHLDHDNLGADIDKHLDHHDRGSIVGHRESCHRPVGARTRHHRVSHG